MVGLLMLFSLYSEIRQIRSQILAFVLAQNAHGKAHEGPDVGHMIVTAIVSAQVFDLGVAQTGLSEAAAEREGLSAAAVKIRSHSRHSAV